MADGREEADVRSTSNVSSGGGGAGARAHGGGEEIDLVREEVRTDQQEHGGKVGGEDWGGWIQEE